MAYANTLFTFLVADESLEKDIIASTKDYDEVEEENKAAELAAMQQA